MPDADNLRLCLVPHVLDKNPTVATAQSIIGSKPGRLCLPRQRFPPNCQLSLQGRKSSVHERGTEKSTCRARSIVFVAGVYQSHRDLLSETLRIIKLKLQTPNGKVFIATFFPFIPMPPSDLLAFARAAAVYHELDLALVCAIIEQESAWNTHAIRYTNPASARATSRPSAFRRRKNSPLNFLGPHASDGQVAASTASTANSLAPSVIRYSAST